jgi:hypothetical protein
MPLSTPTLSGQELIAQLLERSPPGVARTFTAEQLETIEQVFAATSYTSQGQSDDEWQQNEVGEARPPTPTALQAAHPSVADRRRPGRSEFILPTLIALLRRPTDAVEADLDDDDIRAAQGLAIAVLLSLPFWLLVGIGVGFLLSKL